MILEFSTRCRKAFAFLLLGIFYTDFVMATYVRAISTPHNIETFTSPVNQRSYSLDNAIDISIAQDVKGKPVIDQDMPMPAAEERDDNGPTQPEMQQFQSVNSNNMVDLFTGDFAYNIPLLDVGGYPVNLSYRSGITMDQDASWVGLGWNINPGTITRSVRGVPDDFNGSTDSVKKVVSVKENKTIGGSIGADVEVLGTPLLKAGGSIGAFYNTYRGVGIEHSLNASINAGNSAKGGFTGGLSITNSSQDGVSLSPSFGFYLRNLDQFQNDPSGSLSAGFSYNSRYGIKGLQLSLNMTQHHFNNKAQQMRQLGSSFSSVISFSGPSYTPTITMPYTSTQFSFTGKVGWEQNGYDPNIFASGYVTKQRIDASDTLQVMPTYGYLNYQNAGSNTKVLLDYNREKEIAYRDNPPIPNIAIPSYTYDVYSISGEGTGGMFRPYRSDVGFVYDHQMRTKDKSDRVSIDVGVPALIHGGVDLNLNRAVTQNGPWVSKNPLAKNLPFTKNSGLYEAAYFRNPAEKAIIDNDYYKNIGGDDLVSVNLYQDPLDKATIFSTNYLNRYRNSQKVGSVPVYGALMQRQVRDKRQQVITYMTAKEAAAGSGLFKYIPNYGLNKFPKFSCYDEPSDLPTGAGTGLMGYYYDQPNFQGNVYTHLDPVISFGEGQVKPAGVTGFPNHDFTVRWIGRIKAPVTGTYVIRTKTDDGARLWINDEMGINDWDEIRPSKNNNDTVTLIEGRFYDIRMDYFQGPGYYSAFLQWSYPGQSSFVDIPTQYLYPPATSDSYTVNDVLTLEKRINAFRKPGHISEVDVLSEDGRRYIYGIPVYNLKQKEVTFSVDKSRSDIVNGVVGYTPGIDNTTKNKQGKDNYFNKEEMSAYAHSYLLTGILSPDYQDLTGNGISDDDPGDAIKFNYSKVSGTNNAYGWRAPYLTGVASYNEGLRTDNSDDKGNYIYGEKELWYMNSIESKNMIATFTLEDRKDALTIDENGTKDNTRSVTKRLKQIDLYTKADFLKNPATAVPIKTVHFEYSYELCRGVNGTLNDSGKLTLTKVWFTYNGIRKGELNPYTFKYHNTNPRYSIKAYDRWGNYKDPAQNPGSTSGNVVSNLEYPYALQDSAVAADNAGAWTLNNIKLPSGGNIHVDYESDDYAYVQNKRATAMFKIAGFSSSPSFGGSNYLFANDLLGSDNYYVYVESPVSLASKSDMYKRFLEGISKVYFKLYVKMPSDKYGSGFEYISCYASLDEYDIVSPTMMRFKLKPTGGYSPLSKAAIQFLRLNLPSKAYPGSDIGNDLDLRDALQLLYTQIDNYSTAFAGFDQVAHKKHLAREVDLSRSYVRLNKPDFKKYGGGLRVKRIVISDNWDKMTGQAKSTYGQEYSYTTTKEINGVKTVISSGVASYEPATGNDENPFRIPIEYTEQIAPLAPVSYMYTEEPLGETFFPGASVGYSKVRVRSLHAKNIRSANGYEESNFYTAYDFPTYTERTTIDKDTKKRYNPTIANFLRIDAKHHLVMSQGFKVELNDMHGKLRSQATYPETDSVNPISYTENFYKVDNPSVEFKRLNNTVTAINSDASVNAAAVIGKDVELMMDFREQQSVTNGNNFNINGDLFTVPWFPPIFFIPTALGLAQREENIFRSAATVKVINRSGILDSVVHIEKGSLVSTKNMAYDAETGDVLLSRTQNEFNDPVYNFSYPAHWAYEGMSGAYKNAGATFEHVYIKSGKIVSGLTATQVAASFSSGDEILMGAKTFIRSLPGCTDFFSTFPDYFRVWAVDQNILNGSAKELSFIDTLGRPVTASDVSLKIIRSGRRNIGTGIGSISMLSSPLVDNGGGNYSLNFSASNKIINAAALEYGQLWKVNDLKRKGVKTFGGCTDTSGSGNVASSTTALCCAKSFFDYLLTSRKLMTTQASNTTVQNIVTSANAAGYTITASNCPLIGNNLSKPFYALSPGDTITNALKLRLGDDTVTFRTANNDSFYVWTLYQKACGQSDSLKYTTYKDEGCVMYQASGYNSEGATYHWEWTKCNNDVDFRDGTYDWALGPLDQVIQLESFAGKRGSIKNQSNVYIDEQYPIYTLPPIEAFAESTTHSIGGGSSSSGGNSDLCCAKNLFDYLISSKRLFISQASNTTVQSLINDANSAGYSVTASSCSFLNSNKDKLFYAVSTDSIASSYTAMLGSYQLTLSAANDTSVNIYKLKSTTCNSDGIHFSYVNRIHASCTYHEVRGFGAMGSKIYYSYVDCYGKAVTDTTSIPIDWDDYTVIHPLGSICGNNVSVLTEDPNAFIGITDLQSGCLLPDKVDSIPSLFALKISGAGCPDSLRTDTSSVKYCFSILTDTTLNPYLTGVLGNFRVQKNYVYYGARTESSAVPATDIKTYGTFASFAPFWYKDLVTGKIVHSSDTTRWVWNTMSTAFNKRGFEIENKDALGRYNSGLYGYNANLPIAVNQNSRYNEAAFDGFEDYKYTATSCDTACPPGRHLDFSNDKYRLSIRFSHTGLYSMMIQRNDSVSVYVPTVAADSIGDAGFNVITGSNACVTGSVLTGLHTTKSSIIPSFSPVRGQKMLFSCWVKESEDCSNLMQFENNEVIIRFQGGSSQNVTLKPSGHIIEGWQRYEGTFDIPLTANAFTLTLKAKATDFAYFDDLRLHPFHANIKSFVYDPNNLRLVAELDENNYATFYEYDDEGTLIRVKKETERGIQTIRETRSSLQRQ